MAAGSWRTMSIRDILADIDKMPNIAAQCNKKMLRKRVVSHYLLMSKKYF